MRITGKPKPLSLSSYAFIFLLECPSQFAQRIMDILLVGVCCLRLRRIVIALCIVIPILILLYFPLAAAITIWLICLLAASEHVKLRSAALERLAGASSSQISGEDGTERTLTDNPRAPAALKEVYRPPAVSSGAICECVQSQRFSQCSKKIPVVRDVGDARSLVPKTVFFVFCSPTSFELLG